MFNEQAHGVKNTFQVLNSLNELPAASKIALFGAGETGQEFVRKLRISRPDVEVVCFFDSFSEGSWENISIRKSLHIESLSEKVDLIITSVFWNEISEIVDQQFSRSYKILSNDLINQASHLSSYGSFYFSENIRTELEGRFAAINNKFRTPLDREILRNIFDLRVYQREEDFFTFMDQLIRSQKKSFSTKDKYSKHLELASIGHVIEGGVFDGQDTYLLLEILKKSVNFRKMYAFDPFLESLYKGEYFGKIDLSQCEFHQNVLWDCEEKIGFRVDRANPANSTVLRESEFVGEGYSDASHSAITIDTFLAKTGTPVDLIKLDVEGSEMNVLNGAKKSILKHRPRLAISLYHRKEHLLEIPEFLLSIHKDYTFSVSVNNPTFIDMVLYAV
jgi:FkbM family methyltransferase